MNTAAEIPFADGTYRFWLPMPQVIELERKTESSISAIEERLRGAIGVDGEEFVFIGGGSAMMADVRETIRLGLIGGGSGMVDGVEVEVGPNTARALLDAYVYPTRPLSEGILVAWRILHAAIHGIELKKKAEAPAPAPKPKARSPKGSVKGK